MTLLQTVRDLIAAAEPELTDMAQVGAPGCGTPGCIIGWAKSLSPELHDAEFPELFKTLGLILGYMALLGPVGFPIMTWFTSICSSSC